MPYGNLYFGKDGFLNKKMGGAGIRKNPVIKCNGSIDLNNRYVSGSGIGASTISNRRAKLQRSATCSPFCIPKPIPIPPVPPFDPCSLLPKNTPYQLCSPWPKFGGIYNTNTALSPFISSQKGILYWKSKTNSLLFSSPTIASDGTIYIGSTNGSLYAFNSDGTTKWITPPQISAAFQSSPTIASDGTIYIGCSNGILYAFNSNGSQKWISYLGGVIYSSPVIGRDGTIYIASLNTISALYALNPFNGSQKWQSNISDNFLYITPAINLSGDTIYIGCVFQNLFAINTIDGSQKWSFLTTDGIVSSASIGKDGTIYIGCNDNNLYAITDNGTNPILKWSYPINFSFINYQITSSVAIDKTGTLYVGSSDGILYSLTNTGTLNWQHDYSTDLGSGTYYSSPSIGSDGIIYIGYSTLSNLGYLIAVDSKTGKLEFHTSVNSTVISSPAIGKDGTIYIGSTDNHLYAFK